MRHLVIILILLFARQGHALDWETSPEVGKLFRDAGVQGTFVLYDVTADRTIGHNLARSGVRFIPASTFKIANTLIGLSVGAVTSVDELLPYGGKPQPIKAWEHDMGLREAIKISNVPIYQELARRINLERMGDSVIKLDFGNKEIGGIVDNFWLIGPLKISAVEQTQFLARMARDKLPFPKNVQAKTREIIELEHGDGWKLYGKTGWANAPNPNIGWWVGWVEKGDRVYAFALNIDMLQSADATKRIDLGKASLKALGVL